MGWRRWSWKTWSSRPNPPHPHGWWPSYYLGTRALWLVLGDTFRLHRRALKPRPFRILAGVRVWQCPRPCITIKACRGEATDWIDRSECEQDWSLAVPRANTINTRHTTQSRYFLFFLCSLQLHFAWHAFHPIPSKCGVNSS